MHPTKSEVLMDNSNDSSHIPKSLGLYLKRKRIEKGLTQSDVAGKLGYGSPQFISNIERGISSVPLKSLRVIVEMYGLSADEVVNILLDEKRKYYRQQLGLEPGGEVSDEATA